MKKSLQTVLLLASVILFLLSSCVNSRKLAYFNNVTKDSTSQIQVQLLETKISKNDILQINITTLDEATTRLFNAVTLTSGTTTPGYLVDETGIIKIPLIGPLKAEGLTKIQLANLISETILAKKYAKEPIVTVRILNYKVTILGEVARPGVIPVPNERITLPEALGAAGDLTSFGRRQNVLLIREVNGQRIYKRFSLNQDQMFDKDIYNLQNQDIIYVEPNNARAATADRSTQLIPLGFSVVSLLITLYVLFVR
jgi:polysaccharide export outer membrane protein